MDTKRNKKETVIRFDSLGEVCQYVKASPYTHRSGLRYDFAGCTSQREGAEYVLKGASERDCQPAMDLIAKIDVGIHGRKRNEWTPDVFGAYPMVPDVLAGMPLNMRHKRQVESELSPISVYIDVGVSGGVSQAQLVSRGAACAALVMALAELRPVELYAVWAGMTPGSRETVAIAVKQDVNPVSVPHIVSVFASPQFPRCNMFTVCAAYAKTNDLGGLPFGWGSIPGTDTYAAYMRAAMGMAEQDIFIPGGYLYEAGEMLSDPVGWVNKYLADQRDAEGGDL